MANDRSYRSQMLLSLAGAALIVLITILIVTLNLGEGLDPEEIEQREERREERFEERQERLEEQREEGADAGRLERNSAVGFTAL
jgi:hypothetical protein